MDMKTEILSLFWKFVFLIRTTLTLDLSFLFHNKQQVGVRNQLILKGKGEKEGRVRGGESKKLTFLQGD